jgi:hypothetical protein
MAKKLKRNLNADMIQVTSNRFWRFHAKCPHVYNIVRSRALRLQEKGQKNYSIGAIISVLRYEYDIADHDDENDDVDDDTVRIPSGVIPYYARMLMDSEPSLMWQDQNGKWYGFFDIASAAADFDFPRIAVRLLGLSEEDADLMRQGILPESYGGDGKTQVYDHDADIWESDDEVIKGQHIEDWPGDGEEE